MKKFVYLVFLLSIMISTYSSAQWSHDGVPRYLRADYFEQFPDFYKYPINGRIRYYEATPEELKFMPDQTRFLTNDGIEVVNISSSLFANAKTETWMSINPTNPDNIVATCNDNAFLGGFQGFKMSAFASKDGGRTWVHSPTPSNHGQWFTPTGNQATIFDPGTTFDSYGNVYYIYGFSETSWGSQDKDTEKNGVFIVKSTNGGITWDGFPDDFNNNIVPITFDAFNSSGNPFHDRYTMTIDNSPTSPYKDNLYVTWRVFRGVEGVVMSRSTDGGESWSSYTKFGNNGQAPQPVTGPNGELYITWIDVDWNGFSKAMFIRSLNGGTSFDIPYEAQRVSSIGTRHPSSGRFVLAQKQGIRVSSVPQMAVDNSNSPHRGTIYVVQAGRESTTGPYGIYLAKSTDQGKTWANNIRIDNSAVRNDMFFPSIACDPVSGMISVLYYSSQNDPDNIGVDAYVAISNDGGNTWKHLRISPETFYLKNINTVFPQGGEGNVYWGDYTHIVSYNNRVFPLYWQPTDMQNYSYGTNALFTAFISPAPQQPMNADFETMVSPTRLQLKWTHPTKNLLGENLEDFKINVYKNGEKIGEVAKNQEPVFIDNDVVYGASYNYWLETEVTPDLRSVYTQVNALVGGNPKPKAPTDFTWRPVQNGIMISWRNPSQTVADQPIYDKLKLAVYDGDTGEIIEVIGSSEFTPGEVSTHNIVLDTEKFYHLKIKSVAVRGDAETESDFSSESVYAYSGNPVSDINETFDNIESLTPMYIKGKWSTTDIKAASLPNSFTDSPSGNYEPNTHDYFILPPMELTAEKSTISFDHIALIDTLVRFNTEGQPSYDYGEIAYSIDFGKTWKFLKWLNFNASENFIMGNIEASQWQSLAYNLSENVGDTVMFKFTFNSNDFRNGEGWFIDNITMDNRPSSVKHELTEMSKVFVSPNPVSSDALVSLKLPVDAVVKIELYNILGSKIESRDLGILNTGEHYIDFNLSTLANGIYYYKVSIGNYTKTVPVSVNR